MSLVLEDAIQLITPDNVSELGNQILEIVNHLDNLFKLEDKQIDENEFLEFSLKLQDSSRKVISNKDLIEQMKVIKEFQNYSNSFRLKYHDFLPKSFIKELESIDLYSDAIIQLTASQFIMLSAALNNDDKVENFRSFYSGLLHTQEVVEKYIVYLPDNVIQSINLLAKRILGIYQNLTSETKNSFKSKKIEKYIILTKNVAVAIIWKLNEHNTNSPKKFKNLDELWDYWDEVFDETEMEETSEALIQALNETREKQGKSKLFK